MKTNLPFGLSFPYPFPKTLPYSRYADVGSRMDRWSMRGEANECHGERLRSLNAASGTTFPEPEDALAQLRSGASVDAAGILSRHPDERVRIAVLRALAPASGRMADLKEEAAGVVQRIVTSACPAFTPWNQAVTTHFWTPELDAIATAFHADILAGGLQPVRTRLQALCTWVYWMHPDQHFGDIYRFPYLLQSGLVPTYAGKTNVALVDRTLEQAPEWAHVLLWLPETTTGELLHLSRRLLGICQFTTANVPMPAWASRTLATMGEMQQYAELLVSLKGASPEEAAQLQRLVNHAMLVEDGAASAARLLPPWNVAGAIDVSMLPPNEPFQVMLGDLQAAARSRGGLFYRRFDNLRFRVLAVDAQRRFEVRCMASDATVARAWTSSATEALALFNAAGERWANALPGYNQVNDEHVIIRDNFSVWSADPDNVVGRLMCIASLPAEVRDRVGITRRSIR